MKKFPLVFLWLAASATTFAALPEVAPTSAPREMKVGDGTVQIDGKSVQVKPTTLSVAPPKSFEKSESYPVPANYAKHWENWLPWPELDVKKNKQGAFRFPRKADENGALMLGSPFDHYPPEHIKVTASDGKVLKEGEHYKLLPEFGRIANIDGKMGKPMTDKVTVDYVEVYERLDLLQVDSNGKASIKQGEPRITCPYLPEADAGQVGIAGIFVNAKLYGEKPLTEELIWEIDPADPIAPINPEATYQTLARLHAGKDVSIAFMGDSITLGAEAGKWWSDDTQYWRGRFVHTLEERFPKSKITQVKAWQGGKGTEFGVQMLNESVLPSQPDLLIVMMGINDADSSTHGNPKVAPDEYAKRMGNIIKAAQEAGIEVLLMTSMQPYPFKANGHAQRWPEYVDAQLKLAEQFNVGLANTYAEWLNLSTHGIPPYSQLHNWNNHPGSFGHSVLASVPLRFFPAEIPAGVTLPAVKDKPKRQADDSKVAAVQIKQQQVSKDGLTVTAPDHYVKGQAFEVKVKLDQAPAPGMKICFSFNCMLGGGKFGGFLQYVPTQISVDGAGEYTASLQINRSKPNLEKAILNVYLSPDGNWKNRVAEAKVAILN